MLLNILKLAKHVNVEITEADGTQHRSPNTSIPMPITVQRMKTEDQGEILKSSRKKWYLTRRGELSEWQPVLLLSMGTRRKWHNVFKYFFWKMHYFYFAFKFKFKTFLHASIRKFEYPLFCPLKKKKRLLKQHSTLWKYSSELQGKLRHSWMEEDSECVCSRKNKPWVYIIIFHLPIEFSRLCLIFDVKIMVLFNVILMYIEETLNYIKNEKRQKGIKRDKVSMLHLNRWKVDLVDCDNLYTCKVILRLVTKS